jgi:hypothetical protein
VSAPSRPVLIGLLSTLLIVGVLFVALKPPGQGADKNSPLNGPIAQAKNAVVESQVAAAKAEAAGSTTAAPAATSTPHVAVTGHTAPAAPVHPVVKHVATKPAAPVIPNLAAGDRSRKVLVALAHHHVAVVLFWTHGGADDDSVRRAVASLKGTHGIDTFAVPIRDVGLYPAITTGVQVTISPTTLVIGPNHQYQEIVGYTDAPAIEQAVVAARG